MNSSVIIVAAGRGLRAGGGETPKQFTVIGGKALLMHTIEAFACRVDEVVVVIPAGYSMKWKGMCEDLNFDAQHIVVEGAEERFLSVRQGLEAVGSSVEVVLVHDGVRPFVSGEVIERVVGGAVVNGAVVPVIPLVDSVRRVDGGSISRSELLAVQTPQGFLRDIITTSYKQEFRREFTDCSSVVEAAGYGIEVVEGSVENFKITTPMDIKIAKLLITNTDGTNT